MRKKRNKNDIALEMVDSQSISTPSPDYDITYKGVDMYWYPEVQKPIINNKTKDTLEELLSLVP